MVSHTKQLVEKILTVNTTLLTQNFSRPPKYDNKWNWRGTRHHRWLPAGRYGLGFPVAPWGDHHGEAWSPMDPSQLDDGTKTILDTLALVCRIATITLLTVEVVFSKWWYAGFFHGELTSFTSLLHIHLELFSDGDVREKRRTMRDKTSTAKHVSTSWCSNNQSSSWHGSEQVVVMWKIMLTDSMFNPWFRSQTVIFRRWLLLVGLMLVNLHYSIVLSGYATYLYDHNLT
jgi:hypothetical protein